MTVSFVSSGFMTLYQSISILLGAGIGTTITSQIVAFNISKYTLFILAIGFCMISFGKTKLVQQSGSGLFGLGLTFHGISTMSSSMSLLRNYQPFVETLIGLSNPILGIFVASIFTALIQSSTAAVGVVQVLASQELITTKAAVSLVLGANIGTTFTAILAAVGTTKEAIRVAFFNTITKVIGVLIILPFLSGFVGMVENSSKDKSRQIANAHTLFNIGIALLFFPLARRVAAFLTRLFPESANRDGV